MKKKITTKIIVLIIILSFLWVHIPYIFPSDVKAQETTWAKIYGSPANDIATSIIHTSDGNYLVAGNSNINAEGEKYGLAVIKVDKFGNLIWCRRYGGENSPNKVGINNGFESYYNTDIVETKNHEYVIVNGHSIIRISEDGNLIWVKKYGRYFEDPVGFQFNSIEELSDTDLIVSGNAIDGDEKGHLDAMVARLDSSGNIKWIKGYPEFGSDFSTIKPIGNSGFILGCYSSGYVAWNADKDAALIIRLDPQGEIIWAKSYCSIAMPNYSLIDYGRFFDLCLTNDNGIIVLRSPGSAEYGGSSIFKLNLSGDIVWSKYFHSTVHGGETYLMALTQLSNSNIAIVGGTTEFSEYTHHAFLNTIAITINENGDFLWIKVLGRSSEDFTSEDIALAVTEGDDGGIVYAGKTNPAGRSAGRTNSFDNSRNFLVVKMDADGGVSKAGNFLIDVDPHYSNVNDPLSVLIKSPALSVRNVDKVRREIDNCNAYEVSYDFIECGFSEKTLEGTSSEKLILEPLYPSNATEPSKVMQGGVVYRYFTLKRQSGEKVADASIKYYDPFSNKLENIKSNENGEVVLKFSTGASTNCGTYDIQSQIRSIKVAGVKFLLLDEPSFSVEVVPLTYASNWTAGVGSSVKAGVGVGAGSAFGELGLTGGMLLIRTKSDPLYQNKESLGISENTQTDTTAGLEAGLEFGGKAGPVEAEALNATASITENVFGEFATLFNAPSNSSAGEKLVEGFSILTGVANCLSYGTTQTLNMVINTLIAAISDKVAVNKILQGIGFEVKGELTGVELGISKDKDKDNGASMDGLGIGNIEGTWSGKIFFTQYVSQSEMSGKVVLKFDASISAVTALGFDVGEIGTVQEMSLEVVLNNSNFDFKRAVISFSTPPDSHGEVQSINFTVTAEMLGDAINEIEQLGNLVVSGAGTQESNILIDKNMLAALLNTIMVKVSDIEIPYERVVSMDKEPTEVEIGLGANIFGFQVDLGVKPKFGSFKSYTYETGILFPIDKNQKLMRLVKYTSYPTTLFSKDVDKLSDMLGDILSAVGDVVKSAWNIATGTLSNLKDTTIDVASGIGDKIYGTGEAIFEAGSKLSSISDNSVLLSLSSVSAVSAKSNEVTLLAYTPQDNNFIVGNFYAFEPEKKVSKPVAFTITYEDIAIKGRDEDKFSMYYYDVDKSCWRVVEGQQKYPDENKITAKINKLGEYCIGYDVTPPSFEPISFENNGTVYTDKPNIQIKIIEDGSQVDPEGIILKINGKNYNFSYIAKTKLVDVEFGEALVKGTNTLFISVKDTAGNYNEGTFKLIYYVPPAQPSIKLVDITDSYIELSFGGIEKGEQEIKEIVIERAEPYNGKMFHKLASLGGTSVSFKDTDLSSSKKYAYRIYVVDTKGVKGLYSNVVYATSKRIPLNAPNNLTASFKENSVSLKWQYDEKSTVEQVFLVYRGESESVISEVVGEVTKGNEFVDNSVELDKVYYYQVQVYDAGDTVNKSSLSNTAMIETKATVQSKSMNWILFVVIGAVVAVVAIVILARRKRSA